MSAFFSPGLVVGQPNWRKLKKKKKYIEWSFFFLNLNIGLMGSHIYFTAKWKSIFQVFKYFKSCGENHMTGNVCAFVFFLKRFLYLIHRIEMLRPDGWEQAKYLVTVTFLSSFLLLAIAFTLVFYSQSRFSV